MSILAQSKIWIPNYGDMNIQVTSEPQCDFVLWIKLFNMSIFQWLYVLRDHMGVVGLISSGCLMEVTRLWSPTWYVSPQLGQQQLSTWGTHHSHRPCRDQGQRPHLHSRHSHVSERLAFLRMLAKLRWQSGWGGFPHHRDWSRGSFRSLEECLPKLPAWSDWWTISFGMVRSLQSHCSLASSEKMQP